MGVRPPSNGGNDEPASIEFGIAAVDAVLKRRDISFPATKRTLEGRLGDESIPYDVHGNTIPLSQALAELEADAFEDRQELLNALHPVFETYREEYSGGVFAQIRSMLPF